MAVQTVKLCQYDDPLKSATARMFSLSACGYMSDLLIEGGTITGYYSPAISCHVGESFLTENGWHFHLDDIETEVIKS